MREISSPFTLVLSLILALSTNAQDYNAKSTLPGTKLAQKLDEFNNQRKVNRLTPPHGTCPLASSKIPTGFKVADYWDCCDPVFVILHFFGKFSSGKPGKIV